VKALRGKTAFITGGGSGIGLGIARAVAEQGMKVALADIDKQAVEQAAVSLRQLGADVMAMRLDVTDRAGWRRVAQEVPATIGPVRLLVNNAGISTNGVPFGEITPELWDRVIAINLSGVYNGIHCFVDGMRAAGGGHIVNTSSMGGLLGAPLLAPYVATKFALVGLSESLRLELADSGIGVSVLCPGGVRTNLWRTSRKARGLPDTETPPRDTSGQSAHAAMDPLQVGRRVIDAILADEPYIVTHPEYRTVLTERHQRLIDSFERAAACHG
jgi:NAD(P)-dependent dehydrogenase (short-subunit alcohol dehydrogenase family)